MNGVFSVAGKVGWRDRGVKQASVKTGPILPTRTYTSTIGDKPPSVRGTKSAVLQ